MLNVQNNITLKNNETKMSLFFAVNIFVIGIQVTREIFLDLNI